ncbi:MAG: metallophosphoesterase [Geobacteraceae bacterium GWC2_58_44]|nr:MAG: metallophosphoesterase [Geobacteraceae bacterium GWC2_58_44]
MKLSGQGVAALALAMHFPLLTPRRALASSGSWKFGVMADTQWRAGAYAGGEPGSCAVSVINALNKQFIHHDVKFAIQVGDLVDVESINGVRTLPVRAEAAQALYDAGIGFFPLRGNHEGSAIAAKELPLIFPQTKGYGPNVHAAGNFQSPVMPATASDPEGSRLNGLSYAFDYDNVRCVMMDQFIRADGSSFNGSTNNNAVDQVAWVDSVLASRPSDSHAFVFSHKNLIGQNHKDVLFGSGLASNAAARDEFISSLAANGVRFQIGGHDHMHHRSLVSTASGSSSVGQIICSSNSYKFYIPKAGDDGRETPLQQELFSIGYYIFTVDGPQVTVDFYSASHASEYGDLDLVLPPGSFVFHLRESFGYSLNGRQFQVRHGDSYTTVMDSFGGTAAAILGGINGNEETDYLTRPLTKTVNTGWAGAREEDNAASKVLRLWGMADNLSLWEKPSQGIDLTGYLPSAPESKKCDLYTLSLSYEESRVHGLHLGNGGYRLATRDAGGRWINAVESNFGGKGKFVKGSWHPGYPLGTYGIDPFTGTAWAVLNHEGEFAVVRLDD